MDDIWLYIFDAMPTWIGTISLAVCLPYDMPFGDMFRMVFRNRKGCKTAETEQGRRAACEAVNGKRKLDDEIALS